MRGHPSSGDDEGARRRPRPTACSAVQAGHGFELSTVRKSFVRVRTAGFGLGYVTNVGVVPNSDAEVPPNVFVVPFRYGPPNCHTQWPFASGVSVDDPVEKIG